jgi:hypothetical protein
MVDFYEVCVAFFSRQGPEMKTGGESILRKQKKQLVDLETRLIPWQEKPPQFAPSFLRNSMGRSYSLKGCVAKINIP